MNDSQKETERILATIEKIDHLKQKGILTQEEFDKLKSGLLNPSENKNGQSPTNLELSTAKNSFTQETDYPFQTYENSTYGIKIQYPSNWEGTETQTVIPGTNRVSIVEFGLPLVKSSSGERAYKILFVISIDMLPSHDMSIERYTQEEILRLKKSIRNFKIIESVPSVLAGSPALRIIDEYDEAPSSLAETFLYYGVKVKEMRTWTISGNNVFEVQYVTPQISEFPHYLKIVERMLDSFQITSTQIRVPLAQTNFLLYESPDFGIRLKFPANWIADEKNHPNDGDYTQIVGFLSPLDGDLVEKVGVYVKDINSYNMNFEEYVNYYIEGIKRKIRKPSTLVINELTPCHIAENSAYKLIYQVNSAGLNDTKTQEFLISKAGKIYVVSYNSEQSRYEDDLSKLQSMINSFEIIH